jgi:pyruvate dehydrogenase E1 component alpha subunit
LTYRHRGHSKSDRNRYRTKEEIESWIARDPIQLFQANLLAFNLIQEAEVADMVTSVEGEIEAAVSFAKDSPDPKVEDLTSFVYTNTTSETTDV